MTTSTEESVDSLSPVGLTESPETAPPEPEGDDARVQVLRQETEVESRLGPDIKSPVRIPKDYTPSEGANHALFRIEISDFAGPLDLLLYLIRKHEIDIFDIPIAFITERYLEMLKTLGALPIDIAADFMVMASELMHIKSKMLLPAKEGVVVESEDEEEEDPRVELVRRLLEYQKYREAADNLENLDRLGRDVFARVPPSEEPEDELDPGLKEVSIFKLVEVMSRLTKKAQVFHEISFDPIKVSDRVAYVRSFGEVRGGRFKLGDLFQAILNRTELVITFIGVLEMTRLGMVRIRMEDVSPGVELSEEANDDELPIIWLELTGEQRGDLVRDDYR